MITVSHKISLLLSAFLLNIAVSSFAAEPDRALVAIPSGQKDVYLSWRLLASDPEEITFNVYRILGEGAKPEKLNKEPINVTTDFLDSKIPKETNPCWYVKPVLNGREGSASDMVTRPEPDQAFKSIKLEGDFKFMKVGVGDLNGDGRTDYVLKHPNCYIDPYYRNWHPSQGTYKLEAYTHDGQLLWRKDLGWSIELGVWYSPMIVYDFDQDGKAEVALKYAEGDHREPDGKVRSGPEYIAILDGESGNLIDKAAWLSRDRYGDKKPNEIDGQYNLMSRNLMTVAYLDGKIPHIIIERGTYGIMRACALRFDGKQLHRVWDWDNESLGPEYWSQGGHFIHGADVDNDGKDEVVLGSCVLDDNGMELWSAGLGHCDHNYVGDLDPNRPGLEIYYAIEGKMKQNGSCMVDAATGEVLWGLKHMSRHFHREGMVSDIDAKWPGAECYSGEQQYQIRFLWTAEGILINTEDIGGLAPKAIYWDADLQRELLVESDIVSYRGDTHLEGVEGKYIMSADIIGDWREEIVTTVEGEMRIYTTSIPAEDRHVWLMEDRLYRNDVATGAMGYLQIPMLSFDLESYRLVE